MSTLLRGHGLGNDYLVWEGQAELSAAQVVKICDRHTGVGSDGILEPRPAPDADYGVRIWNPDGSIAEKSGNGLRIFAQWLRDHRSASVGFTVSTGFDTVHCAIRPDGVRVEMGTARAEPVHVPLQGGFDAVRVDVGNPHCVRFVRDFDLDWRALGAAIEHHPLFPNRTNVQFVTVGQRIDARIWERGAGETQASGSSSCAVAVAAVYTDRRAPGAHTIHMPGGTLLVEVERSEQGFPVVLTGPVELVCRIELLPGWL